jgi:hypothetical protein
MRILTTTALATVVSLFVIAPAARAFDIMYVVEGELALADGSDPLGLDGAGFMATYTIDSETTPSINLSNRTNYLGQATTVIITDPGGPADGTWNATSPSISVFRSPGEFIELREDLTVAGEPFTTAFQISFPGPDMFPPSGAIPLPLFGSDEVDFTSASIAYGQMDPEPENTLSLVDATARSMPIPEPASAALLAIGLIAALAGRRCR